MNWREFQKKQKVSELSKGFISYIDEGPPGADPVVLIHGIPTWGFLWNRLLPVLSKTHRVLIPDLMGFGFSSKADHFDRSIGAQAEYLNEWMEALGIEDATIIAHDIGGGVALRLATFFKERVARLCVMNCVCYDSWPIELMLQLGHPSVDSLMSAKTLGGILKKALRQGVATEVPDEVFGALLAPYETEVGKLSLIRNASSLNTNLTTELTALLPQIRVPALILWGVDDKFQLFKYAERLARDLPNARLVPVKEARHFVMLDQPKAIAREIRSFLTVSATSSVQAKKTRTRSKELETGQ